MNRISPITISPTQSTNSVRVLVDSPSIVQTFSIQNRRYLGSKYRLLSFIEEIVGKECKGYKTFCDIFAGTGVVGAKFNDGQTEIIANDILSSSIVCLKTFLMTDGDYRKSITHKIDYLNSLQTNEDNYFSMHFGNSYFSITNARKIGMIRSAIDEISKSEQEKSILLCSLLYAVDKIANTVGHYDAYRKSPDIDKQKPVTLLLPEIDWESNHNNRIYKEDANALVRKIKCDVLYIDPPYNSRQYSDAYHLLENLVDWGKPTVSGIAKKMDRSHIKSEYCLRGATEALEDLIQNANCKYILLSYNNTGESKNDRSNARISDNDIVRILKAKGEVKTFEKTYRAFTTGKSDINGHTERVFFCKVRTAKL